jgi:hypothetical protein
MISPKRCRLPSRSLSTLVEILVGAPSRAPGRATPRWPATGGWGFEGFAGDSRTERAVGADAKAACFNCHAPQKASDYTFSRLRE